MVAIRARASGSAFASGLSSDFAFEAALDPLRLQYGNVHQQAGSGDSQRCARMMSMKMSIGNPAVHGWQAALALTASLLALFVTSPAHAQYACTTNYCIRSQSNSVQNLTGWREVPMVAC